VRQPDQQRRDLEGLSEEMRRVGNTCGIDESWQKEDAAERNVYKCIKEHAREGGFGVALVGSLLNDLIAEAGSIAETVKSVRVKS
jgi:hypothetical protein